MKNHGTFHGAPKVGLGMAKLGVMAGAKASGTVQPIDPMNTGRKISIGATVPVISGVSKSRKNKMC